MLSELEHLELADKLVAGYNSALQIEEDSKWYRSNPYRELTPRDSYYQGKVDGWAEAAQGAIQHLLLTLTHTHNTPAVQAIYLKAYNRLGELESDATNEETEANSVTGSTGEDESSAEAQVRYQEHRDREVRLALAGESDDPYARARAAHKASGEDTSSD